MSFMSSNSKPTFHIICISVVALVTNYDKETAVKNDRNRCYLNLLSNSNIKGSVVNEYLNRDSKMTFTL